MDEMLRSEEMQEHIHAGDFRLAFIGMSNCGKSYRSKVLVREADFFWYEVDKEIQKKLWFSSMEEISHWLGEPSDTDFEQREKIYLEKEEQCTYLKYLDTKGKNLVFDTTGSVICLSNETKSWLKNECLIVNIDVGIDAIPAMLEKYLEEPKPVSWNGMLDVRPGESQRESLERCYPKLLIDRLQKYKKFAHITIPAEELKDTSAQETIEVIKKYLP